MGLFSFFKRTRLEESAPTPVVPQDVELAVDLGLFLVNGIPLGATPAPWMPTEIISQPSGTHHPTGLGIEMGTEQGVLDYVFITVPVFKGSFLLNQAPLTLSPYMTERDILRIFGEPYWTDRSDGETLLFYEYRQGHVELQFEFPTAEGLGIITLMRNGILSVAAQREAYKVTRAWPSA